MDSRFYHVWPYFLSVSSTRARALEEVALVRAVAEPEIPFGLEMVAGDEKNALVADQPLDELDRGDLERVPDEDDRPGPGREEA